MTFPKQLDRFRPISGLATDLPAYEVGPKFYTAGDNVQFRNGFAERASGYAEVYEGMEADAMSIINAQFGGTNYWIYQGATSSWVVAGAAHTDLTIVGALTSSLDPASWTQTLLNGIVVANNGLDVPMYWAGDTAANFLALPNWPATYLAAGVVAHRFHLFAYNITQGANDFPMQILWSNAAASGTVPTTWVASATNDAGDSSLSETPGAIITARSLSDSLLFYKPHSIFAADWIGGNDVYRIRRLSRGTGALTRHSTVTVGGNHLVLTDSDVILTDGISVKSIITDRMRSFLFNQLDQTYFGNAFVVHHIDKDEVWVCIPTTGARYADVALVWNTVHDSWGVRELPDISAAAPGIVDDVVTDETWDADSGAWDADTTVWNEQDFNSARDSLVMASPDTGTPTDTKLYQVESGDTYDGTNVAAYVGKHTMDLGAPELLKLVRRVYPRITATAGAEIFVKVGTQAAYTDAITWSDEETFTVGTSEFVDFLELGRFISVEFRSAGTSSWTLSGFDIETEPRGYH